MIGYRYTTPHCLNYFLGGIQESLLYNSGVRRPGPIKMKSTVFNTPLTVAAEAAGAWLSSNPRIACLLAWFVRPIKMALNLNGT